MKSYKTMLFFMPLALSACGVGAERVEVSGSARELHFAAVTAKGQEPVCIKTASVSQAEPEHGQPIWQVTALNNDKCVSAIDFGREKAEFAQEVHAGTLRPNVLYRVRMSGGGFSLTRDFSISSAGGLIVLISLVRTP